MERGFTELTAPASTLGKAKGKPARYDSGIYRVDEGWRLCNSLAVFKRRVGPGCRRESSQLILHDNACVRSPAPSMLAVLITLLLLFPQGNAVRVYFCASSVRRSNRPDHPGWQLEVSGPSIILLSARNWMLFLISVLDTK